MGLGIVWLMMGLALLYFGSCLLVDGAASTAVMFAVRPVVVGLTVVSLATSAPELLISLIAAVQGSSGISMGNILGSNVINIALVLGASAVIRPVSVNKQVVRVEIPYMIGVSALFWLLCLDNEVGQIDGMVLLTLLGVFLIYGIITAGNHKKNVSETPKKSTRQLLVYAVYVVAGLGMLAGGSNLVVTQAVAMAEAIGLSQTFIGISVVALGTSLPELATSVVAAARGESDISVGNVVGSNLFNICLVMGVVGLLNPLAVEPGLHWFEFPFMVFLSLVLGGMTLKCHGVGKRGGMLFIALFFLYIGISYV